MSILRNSVSELLEKIKEFKTQGFGLPDEWLDKAIEEMKRTEALLIALGGYDLAIYKLRMDIYSLEQCKFIREMNHVRL